MRDPASVSFRAAGRDDARAVADLHADSWRRHYRGAYSDAFLDGDVAGYLLPLWTDRPPLPTRGQALRPGRAALLPAGQRPADR